MKLKHEFKDGKLLASGEVAVDTNNDGQPVVKLSVNLEVDLAEVPDEALSAIMKKRSEKKA